MEKFIENGKEFVNEAEAFKSKGKVVHSPCKNVSMSEQVARQQETITGGTFEQTDEVLDTSKKQERIAEAVAIVTVAVNTDTPCCCKNAEKRCELLREEVDKLKETIEDLLVWEKLQIDREKEMEAILKELQS